MRLYVLISESKFSVKLESPLEFVFQEQSYSSLHSGWSSAWDHVRGTIADFCGVIGNPCGVVAIPVAIASRSTR